MSQAVTLIAYHGKPAEKRAILAQLQRHHDADEIIKGQYWQDGKGCAVGCTVYGSDHGLYEPKFGIPRILAKLEDRIFEGLPNGKAKEWPLRFMSAIKPGADLSMIWPRLALWLLTEELPKSAKTERTKAAIKGVADMYQKWVDTGIRPAHADAMQVRAAAAAAYAYADDAAAYAAAAAAYAAAYAAAAAAYAAAYAAYADDAAAYADDAAAYAAAARGKFYIRCAAKLVELLESAPLVKKAA